MGLSGLSLGHILVVLLVVVLIFGTKRLGSLGADLGEAIKGFRKAMASPDEGPSVTAVATLDSRDTASPRQGSETPAPSAGQRSDTSA